MIEGKVSIPALLEGIRILDWTVGQQGPVATAMLADLGADVIKLEGPKGDQGREFRVDKLPLPGGSNYYFEVNNRNKRGIVLDLQKEKAREILYRLVEKSDVFVHNLRKRVAAKLRVDYQTLSQYNPKLIYASASAYGPEGPDAEKPGVDITGLARSGTMLSMGALDSPPVYPRAMADQIGAVMLAWGVLAALVGRERSGVGQEVHTSLLGSMVFAEGLSFSAYLFQGEQHGRRDRKEAKNPLLNYYRCADGQWLVLGTARDAKYWHDFCEALEIQDVENDPRFDTSDKRYKNNCELISTLDRVFASRPRSEWLERLGRKEDLLCTYMNTIPDAVNDPQVLLNKYIVQYDHPVLGKVRETGFPVTFTRTPASIRRAAPKLGQHTDEVLMEVLGYNQDQIAQLKADGLI